MLLRRYFVSLRHRGAFKSLVFLSTLFFISVVVLPQHSRWQERSEQAREHPIKLRFSAINAEDRTSVRPHTAAAIVLNEEEYFIDVDRSAPRDLEEELRKVAPNLPPRYWLEKKTDWKENKTCAKYPPLSQIKFNNGRWQTLETSNGTFHFYSAYYDNRTLVGRPTIRVLGMLNRNEPQLNTFCQLWFGHLQKPVFANVSQYKYVWNRAFGKYKQGVEQPYLLSCQVPDELSLLVPESVSLVENRCDSATTNLNVVNIRPPDGQMKDFAVCVKGLDHPDANHTVRLIEWLEALSLLGADKVFLYELQVHPNISKALDYYQKRDFVDLIKLTLPGDQPTTPLLAHSYIKAKKGQKRLNELVPYNDCLYRNIYSFKFVVLLDTDELIVPKNTSSWKELMNVISKKALEKKKTPRTTYAARNVYFLDSMQEAHGFATDIPRYMHILQHVYRARNHTKPGAYAKCFHDTQRVLALHNHFPFACLGKGCNFYYIPEEYAQLQHYRTDCAPELRKTCDNEFKVNVVRDTTIWKYKRKLVSRLLTILTYLGFRKSKRLNIKTLAVN